MKRIFQFPDIPGHCRISEFHCFGGDFLGPVANFLSKRDEHEINKFREVFHAFDAREVFQYAQHLSGSIDLHGKIFP